MDFEVGTIHAGKVTGITKFGAFVMIAPGKSGLVHISEISNTYVSDVRSHLAEGQEVTVKVIGVDQTGRMNLSIKAASTEPPGEVRRQPQQRQQQRPQSRPQSRSHEPSAEPTFEDKLKRFMQDSDNKMSGMKQYSDKKGARRRR